MTLVRAIGQGPDLLQDDLNSFREAVRQFTALGRNMNQIARAINSGDAICPSLNTQQLHDVGLQVESPPMKVFAVVMRTRPAGSLIDDWLVYIRF